MFNRLFFLLPNKQQAHKIIDELVDAEFNLHNIHALEKSDILEQTSSSTSIWRRIDLTEQIETVLWNTNLVIFMIALATLLVSLFMGLKMWIILAVVVMVATFFLGDLYSLY
ncbi:MAG: hypothetical protein OEY43_08400, partial [Gammaproteobacteria bacterium]|nr:hypothetical protein [Gammaproteobacteria bacterium]